MLSGDEIEAGEEAVDKSKDTQGGRHCWTVYLRVVGVVVLLWWGNCGEADDYVIEGVT